MPEQIVAIIVQGVVVLVGAGAGSWWGIKGALNGIRESNRRIEYDVTEIRDDIKILRARNSN